LIHNAEILHCRSAKQLQNPFDADAKKEVFAGAMFQLVHFSVWFPASL